MHTEHECDHAHHHHAPHECCNVRHHHVDNDANHHHELGGSHRQVTDEESAIPFVLRYMLEHNVHHAVELQNLIEQLNDEGQTKAARAAAEALKAYEEGNNHLDQAVKALT